MTGWLEYEYLIASQHDECPCPSLARQITSRIEMSPRGQWIVMAQANAMLIVLNDAKGLRPTDHPDRFGFDGDRPDFDHWMSIHHPNVAFEWVDQYVVAFADRAAQLSFNDDLGERVLRAKHLPRTVPTAKGTVAAPLT